MRRLPGWSGCEGEQYFLREQRPPPLLGWVYGALMTTSVFIFSMVFIQLPHGEGVRIWMLSGTVLGNGRLSRQP